MQTLYEKIGGQTTVKSLINGFYQKVFTDPMIGPFFVHTSQESLARMQEEFFTIALGGSKTESNISLRAAHHGRGIKYEHLFRFMDHMMATLKEIGVDETDANDVVARILLNSDKIIGEAPEGG